MALWEEALRVRGSGPKSAPPPLRASTSGQGQRSTQVVIKIATFQKTARGARNTLSYISSHGGTRDDNRLYDDAGVRHLDAARRVLTRGPAATSQAPTARRRVGT